MSRGYWTACDVCAAVYFQPYGKTSREAHGGLGGHDHPTQDEGDHERAQEEADRLNDLEDIAARTPCDMGVGCGEAGVCFAAAHGEPDRCPRSTLTPRGSK